MLPQDRRGSSDQARARRTLFRILVLLDEQRPTGLVLVRLGDTELGRLVVSQGRLCLALTHAAADSQDDELRALYVLAAAALRRGDSLCAAVRGSGQASVLKSALLDESVRALLTIAAACGEGTPVLDVLPARDDYDNGLMLSTSEVFMAAMGAQFALPRARVAEALDGLRAAGAALLLLRSADPTEQPYPVAQHGLETAGVRELVTLLRAASTFSRGGVAPESPALPAAWSLAGESWHCVTGRTALVLFRARAERGAQASAAANTFVSQCDQTETCTPASSSVPDDGGVATVWPVPPSPTDAEAYTTLADAGLVVAIDDVATGRIWPPIEGRRILAAVLAQGGRFERRLDGGWWMPGATWRVLSHVGDRFQNGDAAQAAVLKWARWHAKANGLLSRSRCTVTTETSAGLWRLWQIVRVEWSLRAALGRVLSRHEPEVVARGLLETSLMLGAGRLACAPLGLPCTLDTLGAEAAYIGWVPPLEALLTPAPASVPFDTLLAAEFGPLVRQALTAPSFDRTLVLHHLGTLAAATNQVEVGAALAALVVAG